MTTQSSTNTVPSSPPLIFHPTTTTEVQQTPAQQQITKQQHVLKRRFALTEDTAYVLKRFATVQGLGIKRNMLTTHLLSRPVMALSSSSSTMQERERVFIASLNPYTTKRTLISSFRACICMEFISEDLLITSHGNHTIKTTRFYGPGCPTAAAATSTTDMTFEGHLRTPWVLALHPTHPTNIFASLCLGRHIIVWNLKLGNLISVFEIPEFRIHHILFHPHMEGNLLLVSDKIILSWNYPNATTSASSSSPSPIIVHPHYIKFAHMISSHLIVVSQSIEVDDDATIGEDIKLETRSTELQIDVYENCFLTSDYLPKPRTLVSNVQLYTVGGMGISTCERFIAVLRGTRVDTLWQRKLCVYEVTSGRLRCESNIIPDYLSEGITAIKFSPTTTHLFVGHGSAKRPSYPIGSNRKVYLSIYSIDINGGAISFFKFLSDVDVDVNALAIHPCGFGVLVGTRRGEVFVHDDGL